MIYKKVADNNIEAGGTRNYPSTVRQGVEDDN